MEQKTREVKIQFKYVVFTIIAIAIVIAIIFAVRNAFRKSKTNGNSVPDQPMVVLTPRSDEREINFEQIVAQNEQEVVTEKIERQNVEIEYMTQYRENSSLISGQIQTLQEGQNGSQDAVVRNTYKNGQLVSTSLISSVVTKPSIDKVVEVGTGCKYLYSDCWRFIRDYF